MRKGLKLYQSLLFLLFAVFLLLTSTLAWFTFDVDSEVNELVNVVGKYKVDIKIEISRNGGPFEVSKTEEDMVSIFNNAVPGDTFDFKLSFTNSGTLNVLIDVVFDNIINQPVEYEGLDLANMLDVFVVFNDELEAVPLSELVDTQNSWLAEDNLKIAVGDTEVVEFRLEYDHNTSEMKYQEGKIKIHSITIYLRSEV